jgi:SAM-dependent methyltransferase
LSAGASILDVGGGGSIACYEMALSGYRVTVIDVDAAVCAAIDRNARQLGLADRLRTNHHDGGSAWPVGDETADAVVCVSVFEAMLGRQRALFFAECRRVLKPRAELLLTFDFGPGARLVGDAPRTLVEVRSQIVDASGLACAEPLPAAPRFTTESHCPVRLSVPGVDGCDYVTAAYTFGALRLVRPAAGIAGAPIPAPCRWRPGAGDVRALAQALLRHLAGNGALAGLAPLVVQFEAWDEDRVRRWFWELRGTGARQVAMTRAPVDVVLSATPAALHELLRRPQAFWALHYAGGFRPRGDIGAALRLVDRFPVADDAG